MKPTFSLSDLAALLGMILGTAGFVMSLLTYLRDRHKVQLTLQWDMTNAANGKKLGLVRVANVGRRPVFVSVVALDLPVDETNKTTHLVLRDSIAGKVLTEASGPWGLVVNYEGLEAYAKQWRGIRAYAESPGGERYFSAYPDSNRVPTWVSNRE